jgi:hypothetical protein
LTEKLKTPLSIFAMAKVVPKLHLSFLLMAGLLFQFEVYSSSLLATFITWIEM